MRWRRFLPVAAAWLLCAGSAVGDESLPMSPQGQVWIKPVPEFRVVSLPATGTVFQAADTANLKLCRYAASVGLERPAPLVIELPAVDWTPADTNGCGFAIVLPLAGTFDEPRDESMRIEMRESSKVAALSFSGAYDPPRIAARLRELRDWIAANGQVIVGRPRLLLYHFRAFRPDFAKKAELQVPVR